MIEFEDCNFSVCGTAFQVPQGTDLNVRRTSATEVDFVLVVRDQPLMGKALDAVGKVAYAAGKLADSVTSITKP